MCGCKHSSLPAAIRACRTSYDLRGRVTRKKYEATAPTRLTPRRRISLRLGIHWTAIVNWKRFATMLPNGRIATEGESCDSRSPLGRMRAWAGVLSVHRPGRFIIHAVHNMCTMRPHLHANVAECCVERTSAAEDKTGRRLIRRSPEEKSTVCSCGPGGETSRRE
jgi:hypothetical protein